MPTSLRSTRKNNFTKSERLCSRKAIEALFAGGNRSFTAFPLRVVYRLVEEEVVLPPAEERASLSNESSDFVCQVLVSVSKRHFKHAVDRNRAKRQVREAWRLNKDILICAAEGPKPVARTLHIAFLWLADELQESELIQRKMRNLLHRIAEEINAGDLNNRF